MTSQLDRIAKQRLEKLERIRAQGIEPYPYGYHRSHTTEQAIALLKQHEGSSQMGTPIVNVAGRIMANRSMGKISFLDIHDSSGKIQLLINRGTLPTSNLELFKETDIGDIIGASGKLFRTKTNEPTINVESFTLLAKSLQPLPEKWHGLSDVEIRYRQRYLDLISNPEARTTFKVRSQVIAAIRQFLNQRGFLEVETPILQPSAGGASAQPFVTHHQALDQDFYLRIATELHLKRLIVGGLDKVYELGRAFRNEGIDTKHNPEFTLLESYEAYADYNDVMNMLEEMVSKISQQVLGTDQLKFGDNIISLKPPWQRLELHQAVLEYSGIDFVQYPGADLLRA
ncbi:MAG: amino acid--tRNA ligase-related protein, partial [Chloroflexota bacterium]